MRGSYQLATCPLRNRSSMPWVMSASKVRATQGRARDPCTATPSRRYSAGIVAGLGDGWRPSRDAAGGEATGGNVRSLEGGGAAVGVEAADVAVVEARAAGEVA